MSIANVSLLASPKEAGESVPLFRAPMRAKGVNRSGGVVDISLPRMRLESCSINDNGIGYILKPSTNSDTYERVSGHQEKYTMIEKIIPYSPRG